ncbi:dimethylargininase [Streptomyces lincolnensis]|uniref:dimethylargininase n=1 Tax=Streptomyces lincolnensis TaxID=1915 RepID=UPI0037D76E1F
MRTSTTRRYLMCPPEHFTVTYAINPWMNPNKPVDTALARTQWERIRGLFTDFGHQVDLIDPVPGLPDMVFAANGATVVDGRVLPASFRHTERIPEGPAYADWFAAGGFSDIHTPRWVNEGQGDFLVSGGRILAGSGFRSDRRSHHETQEFFGRPVIGLTLVDPRFYHLDTALTVLDDDLIAYFPQAFSPGSQEVLRRLYPDAVLATEEDAVAFGLNAVSDGRRVVLPQSAVGLAAELRFKGFETYGVDVSELHKAGGAVKCCTLELHGAPVFAGAVR